MSNLDKKHKLLKENYKIMQIKQLMEGLSKEGKRKLLKEMDDMDGESIHALNNREGYFSQSPLEEIQDDLTPHNFNIAKLMAADLNAGKIKFPSMNMSEHFPVAADVIKTWLHSHNLQLDGLYANPQYLEDFVAFIPDIAALI